ncbi:MAG: MFS transporter [Actinomycetota bacterium]
MTVHRTFHSMRHSRNFRLFFIGQAISVTGTWMQMVATAWLVLQLTGSGVALGVETALAFGPILFLGAWGGMVADRHDKRRILVVTQTAFGLLALTLFVLVATDVVELWLVFAVALGQGIITSIDMPTRQSFVAEMVEQRDLTNAVSLNSAVFTGTRIVGPALAGVLIAGVGMEWCFLLNGVSYLGAIGALSLMRREELRPQRAPRAARAIRDGLRFVWQSRELRRPLVLMSVLYLFSFNFSVLFPLFAQRSLDGDAGTLGTLFSLMGVGSFVAALVLAGRANANERRLAVAASAVGLITLVVAFAPTAQSAFVAMVALGAAAIVFLITANSTLQLTAPPEMRGRVMALYGIVFLGSTPIGGPIAGWVGEHLGPRAGLAGGGLIAVVTGALGLWLLSRRERSASRVAEQIDQPSSRSIRQPASVAPRETSTTVPSASASR